MFIIFFIRCFFFIPLPSRTKLAPMTSRSRPENASSSIYSILYPHTASLASTSPLPWLLLPALFALLNYFAVFDYMPILPGAFCASVSEWGSASRWQTYLRMGWIEGFFHGGMVICFHLICVPCR